MFFEICAHRVDKFHHILWDRRMPFHLNSGDWVETLSALTEDEDGNWSVRYFDSMSMPDRELKEKETEQITIAS